MTTEKRRLRRTEVEALGLADRPPMIVFPGPDAAPDIDEPLPDAMFQVPHYTETLEVLRTHFSLYPLTLVYGNSPIYYTDDEGETRRVMPDCYVTFGVNAEAIRRRNGFFLHEVGQAPDFALEIASVSTYRNDLGPKRDLYARLGIGEYWRFDPTGGQYYGESLVGETLVDGEYHRHRMHQEDNGLVWGHSPALGLDLCWEPGRLRFFNPATGLYLLNLRESETRAEAAEAEAADLREQLRRLREQRTEA